MGKLTRKEEKETREETREEETGVRKFQREMLVDSLTNTVFDNKESRMKFALGMMRKDWISSISKIFAGELSITKWNMVLSKTSASFLEEFKKITWRERCKETVEMDKIFGLDLRTKKKKARGKVQGKGKGIKDKGVDEVNEKESELYKEREKKKSESNSIEVEKVIWDVIKKGVKWFGMA